jgi:site-specific DNA-cytosine methylase
MAHPLLTGGDGQGVTANTGEVSHCLLATGPGRLNPTVETFITDEDLKTRYLTPVEYERLQGFPDDFTRIPYGGRPAGECPDSLRYGVLGNSMAIPCLSWIGRRIRESHAGALRYIHIFAGISAACIAFRPLGWRPLAFSEIDPFSSEVLRIRHPGVPNAGDMTAHDWSQYRGECDLVVGGPPCQAFSVTGLRDSLLDGRGNLTLHFARAIRAIQPAWVLTENVPGWLSTHDNAFGCFLAGLAGADAPLRPPNDHGPWPRCGVVSGPAYGAAWRVLDAQYFGVPQSRRRVFVVAHVQDWRLAAGALFERHGADSAD